MLAGLLASVLQQYFMKGCVQLYAQQHNVHLLHFC